MQTIRKLKSKPVLPLIYDMIYAHAHNEPNTINIARSIHITYLYRVERRLHP